jgi:Nucleoside-diphosphate-sugar epimerases
MLYSPYGLLKAVGELYTKSLNGLIVKFWNIYGIEHDFTKSHVITDFILKAKKRGKIDILTDGSEQRQFLFADDCSECLVTLAEKYNEISREENLHITSFKWNSILDIAKIVADLHKGVEVETGKSSDVIQKDKRNEPDPSILKYWKPKTSLFAGIKLIKDAIKV